MVQAPCWGLSQWEYPVSLETPSRRQTCKKLKRCWAALAFGSCDFTGGFGAIWLGCIFAVDQPAVNVTFCNSGFRHRKNVFIEHLLCVFALCMFPYLCCLLKILEEYPRERRVYFEDLQGGLSEVL